MVENDTDAKSCDPQLFMDGEPDSKWGLDDLGGYCPVPTSSDCRWRADSCAM